MPLTSTSHSFRRCLFVRHFRQPGLQIPSKASQSSCAFPEMRPTAHPDLQATMPGVVRQLASTNCLSTSSFQCHLNKATSLARIPIWAWTDSQTSFLSMVPGGHPLSRRTSPYMNTLISASAALLICRRTLTPNLPDYPAWCL